MIATTVRCGIPNHFERSCKEFAYALDYFHEGRTCMKVRETFSGGQGEQVRRSGHADYCRQKGRMYCGTPEGSAIKPMRRFRYEPESFKPKNIVLRS
jgi:hypothetical protein